ncbi:DBF4 [Candida jiufengensis]|uniref:DBF4 n=1 Tax=Candida jiufengensis TaxID=497108 RepID=UPI0022249A83|nr:DBF4 [Candida jiufengensis]KAI5949366.1 DBF4 [Candida jiufengensis]
MDGIGENKNKSIGSDHQVVFKKKFTSLLRPRQPLKETNSNLPTLPSKKNNKKSSIASPTNFKIYKKSSSNISLHSSDNKLNNSILDKIDGNNKSKTEDSIPQRKNSTTSPLKNLVYSASDDQNLKKLEIKTPTKDVGSIEGSKKRERDIESITGNLREDFTESLKKRKLHDVMTKQDFANLKNSFSKSIEKAIEERERSSRTNSPKSKPNSPNANVVQVANSNDDKIQDSNAKEAKSPFISNPFYESTLNTSKVERNESKVLQKEKSGETITKRKNSTNDLDKPKYFTNSLIKVESKVDPLKARVTQPTQISTANDSTLQNKINLGETSAHTPTSMLPQKTINHLEKQHQPIKSKTEPTISTKSQPRLLQPIDFNSLHNRRQPQNENFKRAKLNQTQDHQQLQKQEEEKLRRYQLAQQHQHQHQQQRASTRLQGEELLQWQQSWRKIMTESIVFFEGSHDTQSMEYKKAIKYLKYVGCEIAPFYKTDVTILLSKRIYDDKINYPSNDIFSNVPKFKTKVWSYEKLFRFMANLGLTGSVDDSNNRINKKVLQSRDTNSRLYDLLKEEKIYGSTDRDPTAKRDDFHYFGKNYLYVYDLTQTVRPIAIREWGDNYPILNLSLDGKCPFINDPSDQNSDRKKLKRLRKFEASKSHRQALKIATEKVIHGVSLSPDEFAETSTSTDKIDETSSNEHAEFEFRQPLARNSSNIQSKPIDTMASGFNGASNAMQFSMDSSLNSTAIAAGNGLGPSISLVTSKNLNNLKRRIFMKRKSTTENAKREKESTPGYCENCRCKYDCFDDHINSNRHRNFACDDNQFQEIDELISILHKDNNLH